MFVSTFYLLQPRRCHCTRQQLVYCCAPYSPVLRHACGLLKCHTQFFAVFSYLISSHPISSESSYLILSYLILSYQCTCIYNYVYAYIYAPICVVESGFSMCIHTCKYYMIHSFLSFIRPFL